MIEYPPFALPESLVDKPFDTWSHRDAVVYKDWIEQRQEDRVKGLLNYLNDDGSGAPEEVLSRVESRVREIVMEPQFSEPSTRGPTLVTKGGRTYSLPPPVQRQLTGRGRVLAMDVGLLYAWLLAMGSSRPLRWDVVTKNKANVSFHCPVLSGFSGEYSRMPYDPILIATNSLIAAANHLRGPRLVELFRQMRTMS